MDTPTPTRRLPIAAASRRKDWLIGLGVGGTLLCLLAFGLWALLTEGANPRTNKLVGTIVAKHDTGEREREIAVGQKGLSQDATDSGYSFEVRVGEGAASRIYTVPVVKEVFVVRKLGERQEFIRPLSEQR